jgi:predicted short-subunit dehydrogenase-like oxidoreductase (DUF2520 family)
MNIVLIGAGNVAHHLGHLLKRHGNKIVQVHSKTRKGISLAKELQAEFAANISKLNSTADLYIIAINDHEIRSLITSLTFIPKAIVHTSGSTPLSVFPVRIKNAGVLYPVQTFSKNLPVPDLIPFCIEARTTLLNQLLKKLIRPISTEIININSEKRLFVHLAAVFANNFSNYLFTVSKQLVESQGISFKILRPLIEETADKIKSASPDKTQTGPAVRGDKSTISTHLKILNSMPATRRIYKLLTDEIEKNYNNIKD